MIKYPSILFILNRKAALRDRLNLLQKHKDTLQRINLVKARATQVYGTVTKLYHFFLNFISSKKSDLYLGASGL